MLIIDDGGGGDDIATEPLGEGAVGRNAVGIDGGGSYSFRFCSNLQNFGVTSAVPSTK